MLPSIRPVPYHDPTYEKIITFFVLRFLIYNFSAKEAFWNEGEHFSFNNESFDRPLAWSRNKCRRSRSVQTELMWVGFSWLKLQFFNFNFFYWNTLYLYWLSIFIVMRFIHEPLSWVIRATPSHILTLLNWLIDWLIDFLAPCKTWNIRIRELKTFACRHWNPGILNPYITSKNPESRYRLEFWNPSSTDKESRIQDGLRLPYTWRLFTVQ